MCNICINKIDKYEIKYSILLLAVLIDIICMDVRIQIYQTLYIQTNLPSAVEEACTAFT